ncbi:hypothetical protein BDE02_11G059700 [Populus trichocarpa]|nr:hypothetical protein BDE02_11G059700 [Populus trichocarpa]
MPSNGGRDHSFQFSYFGCLISVTSRRSYRKTTHGVRT